MCPVFLVLFMSPHLVKSKVGSGESSLEGDRMKVTVKSEIGLRLVQ
jgi:hypothetical protein